MYVVFNRSRQSINYIKLVYGGKPLVPDESYDGGFYLLNLRRLCHNVSFSVLADIFIGRF